MVRPDLKRLIVWTVIGTGISSVAVQLVTIREFLTQFHGNEITIALSLFCWLLLTGAGSLIERLVPSTEPALYAFLTLLTAIWPLAQLLVIRVLREAVFVHGVSPGFYEIIFYISATTAPYCLLIGFVLPYAMKVIRRKGGDLSSGRLYLLDSLGDVTGGVIFSFFLVYFLSPFKVIALTSTLLIMISLLLLFLERRWVLTFAGSILAAGFYLFSMNGTLEIASLSTQYGRIAEYLESPYGRIVVSREGSQNTFWESGNPFYSQADIMRSEEKIHYPLSQVDEVGRVLLISGGMGETLNELAKHKPGEVHYVELDPSMTGLARKYGLIGDYPGLRVFNTDGRRHLLEGSREGKRLYDAVIMDLPEPDTFQINRFFTGEFFSLVRERLSTGGVFSFSLACSANYISEVQRRKLSIVYRTALDRFENVMVLPGQEAYFICRNGPLTSSILERLDRKAIRTDYIGGYFEGNVTRERIDRLRELLAGSDVQPNRDFEPNLMGVVFQEWFLRYGTSPMPFILVLSALITAYFFFTAREEYLLFSTGMSVMGVEMAAIFTFQVLYGYIYLKIGAILTAFLGGLLPGALLGNALRGRDRRRLIQSEFLLLLLLLCLLLRLNLLEVSIHQISFLAYGFIFSMICGFQFPLAARLMGEEKSPAGRCIAADLIGAAMGTLIIGALLIPMWGIQAATIFLICLKISSSISLYLVKGRAVPVG